MDVEESGVVAQACVEGAPVLQYVSLASPEDSCGVQACMQRFDLDVPFECTFSNGVSYR